MPYYFFQWTEEIVAHLAENDVSPEDFESIVSNPHRQGKSRSSGMPAAFGYTGDGRYVIAIFEYLDDVTIIP